MNKATQETTAAILLGLVTNAVHKAYAGKRSSGANPNHPVPPDLNLLAPLDPFIEALGATLKEWGQRELSTELPQRPDCLDRRSGYAFLQQMIIAEHRKPETPFHTLLFQHIGAHPVITATIAWLRAPGPPEPLTDLQVNTLIYTLHGALLPGIEEALDHFLTHHCKVTLGFEAIARARMLVAQEQQGASAPEDDPQVRRQRKMLAQQLVIPLLGEVLSGKTPPPARRTLAVWAERGWVAPGEKFKSVLFQALLGPGMDGQLGVRRSGAITQGLLHWYGAEVAHIPVIIDASVGYVQCSPRAAPQELRVPSQLSGTLECPQCRKPLDLHTHRIVAHRHNIAGKVLTEAELSTQSLPQIEEEGQPVWLCRPLATCPPEHWYETLLGQAAVRRAKQNKEFAVLAALVGEDATALADLAEKDATTLVALVKKGASQDPEVRRAREDLSKYKTIRRKLHKLCAGVQKRYAPQLQGNEARQLRERVQGILVRKLGLRSVATGMAIMEAFIKERATLADEVHYFPRTAQRTCPLLPADPAHQVHEAHYGGVGQNPVTLHVRVGTDQQANQSPGEPDREQEADNEHDADGWAKRLAYLDQLYEALCARGPQIIGALTALGVTEEASDTALRAAWERLVPLFLLYREDRKDRDPREDYKPFAQRAEHQLSEMLENWPTEPRPWRNQDAFDRAIYEVLDELQEIITQG